MSIDQFIMGPGNMDPEWREAAVDVRSKLAQAAVLKILAALGAAEQKADEVAANIAGGFDNETWPAIYVTTVGPIRPILGMFLMILEGSSLSNMQLVPLFTDLMAGNVEGFREYLAKQGDSVLKFWDIMWEARQTWQEERWAERDRREKAEPDGTADPDHGI